MTALEALTAAKRLFLDTAPVIYYMEAYSDLTEFRGPVSMNEEMLIAAHEVTSHHRELMEKSALCGCCYCLRVFPPSQIGTDTGSWKRRDDKDQAAREPGWIDNGATALCPYCCVDCLIPEKAGFPLTPEFLEAMHRYWF